MLMETTSEGWGETNLAEVVSQGRVDKDSKDNAGPVTMAMAVSPTDEKKAGAHPTRLVVVGNSRFATNGNIANGSCIASTT